ncbi:formate dehydrogenase accessory sulfurtransferase FdhD [Clostridium sp. 1001270J_160509_D11]|uniref:formate dehydrogenase accessory sulfurtransferase FdhD n=1 Tax=Clostridium sp. 1001270J_160509_D11 TaxID=2787103 RepID=UPI001FABB053|nr:formate dehydrogenase accessory sulfurtransferase FdhD [Clostridium sp. 1001270J_160509_D11]
MENKYSKEGNQQVKQKERLVNYDYKTDFKFEVVKVENKNHTEELETIIGEFPLALVINNEYSNTFLCTPENLEQLVAGFLMTKGVIKSKADIKSIEVDFENRVANTVINKNEDSDKGKRYYLNDLDYVDLKPIENTDTTIRVSDIYEVMKENLTSSELFKNTGGVHSVAIYDNKTLLTIREDVARHNAMDKSIGYCILNNIDLKDKIIFVSGRISCEMILKAAKAGIPIVLSKSAPTNLSREIAKKLNITLAGFVRGERIYPNVIIDEVVVFPPSTGIFATIP